MTTFVVPFSATSAGAVRRRLVAELTARALPGDLVDDAALVMSELLGNAVRHGAPLPGGGLRVTWWLSATGLHLEVCDGGPGPSAPLVAALDTAECGRGLAIIGVLADRWGTTAPTAAGVTGVYADLPLGEVGTAASSAAGRADRYAHGRSSMPA